MSTPPAGTVTFLFTDIEGSTRLWQQHPDPMKAALLRHHALLQHAIESNGGYVFQIVGDAFCAAFHTAADGVAAAVAAQRALSAESWVEGAPLRVRMALHTGTGELHAGEYKSGEYVSGLTLSHTARLLSLAYGGQILVSNATQELVGDDLPAGVELRDLGKQRLRDLARAAHVFQVLAPDLPSVYPPLKSLDVVANNLPRQLTTFIGREREIAEAKRLLAEAHLLTATGPGGSGKTRITLEIAADLVGTYPEGVWLLEFATLAEPALVPQVMATTLGVREEAGRPLPATLTDHLRSKRVMLVFDNCEHLIDASARLAEALLRACPQLKILASSREPLGVAGEVVLRIPSLSMPDAGHLPSVDRLTEYEAIRLFVDRARAVKPEFVLTEANATGVTQLCQRLDGIPLAIELAAARVKALSVQQIIAHLDERFRLLTGGSRTALPRHQTLRGLMDWSHGLLSEPERALFRRLSVFAGGWTLGAAEAVGADGAVERYDVVELLGRLVDKSLVLVDEQSGEARYRFLETIRQYGLEKLIETADGKGARDRHRDFCLEFAEDAEQRLQGREQVGWLKRFETEHDNLRAALRWSLDQGDMERALRLGSALWLFWDTHGYVSEGREWLDELLARAGTLSSTALKPVIQCALAKVLDGAACMRLRCSEFAKARELWDQALVVWRGLGDKRGVAETLNNLGDLSRQLGGRARGKVLIENSLALFRELCDKRGIAHALNNLAVIVSADGDHARARGLFEESVPLFRAIGDTRGLSHALDNLGGILAEQGDYGRAEVLYGESLRLAEELGDRHAIATALRSLGAVAHCQHDHAQARNRYKDSVARFREMNDGFCLAKTLIGFALAEHDTGDRERAWGLADEGVNLLREVDAKGELIPRLNQLGEAALGYADVARAGHFFSESLALAAGVHDNAAIATNLEDLARVAAARGHRRTPLRLLAAADAIRRAHGLERSEGHRDECDHVVAIARRRLGAVVFESVWAEGASMTIEQAMTYAQEHLGNPIGDC